MTKGCPRNSNGTLGRVFPQPKSFNHYVRCCKKDDASKLITGCTSYLDGKSRCLTSNSSMPYDRAVELCEDNDMSLCNSKDLDFLCCATGCQFDRKWIWVSNQGIIYLV